MGLNTKLKFSGNKFDQCSGDTINLSGCTQIYGAFNMESGSTLSICNDFGVGKVLTSDGGGVGTWQVPVSTASGENVTKEVNQSTHGFGVKDFIGWSGGTYNKAIADGNYDGEFVGLVTEVPDVDNFSVTQSGYITGLTGVVINTTYFLSESTAGLITDTEPTGNGEISKAVLIANSTTSGWVLPYVGYVISSGATSISTADNGLTDNGGIVGLGGTLCQHTIIDGASNTYDFCVCDARDIKLIAGGVGYTASIVGYNSYLCGTNAALFCSPQLSMSFSTQGLVTDTAGTPRGLKYGGNYRSTFLCNSLVDAAYVTGLTSGSSCGDYAGNAPATCTVGGITAGAVLTGCTLECLLQEILAPYIEPTFSAFSIATTCPAEVGSALSGSKTFSWTTSTSGNVASNSIGILDVTSGVTLATGLTNDGSEALNIGTKTNTSAQTWTWQVSGCSTQGSSFTRNKNVCSIYPYYWGKLTSGGRPGVDNDLVTGGTKAISSSTGTVTVSFSSASNEYTWLAIPATSTSKTCWYVTALDNGLINDSPSDKYPDECVLDITSGQGCWSTVSYKVYMSGAVGEISAAMQFRNS